MKKKLAISPGVNLGTATTRGGLTLLAEAPGGGRDCKFPGGGGGGGGPPMPKKY